MTFDPRGRPRSRPVLGTLANALAPELASPNVTPSLDEYHRSVVQDALSIAARYQRRPALGLLAPFGEPEVPESQRPEVAWVNLTGSWHFTSFITREGRLVLRDHYGDRNSDLGWEVGRLHPGCLDGRYTRSNIIAQHWHDNASEGGSLSALGR